MATIDPLDGNHRPTRWQPSS